MHHVWLPFMCTKIVYHRVYHCQWSAAQNSYLMYLYLPNPLHSSLGHKSAMRFLHFFLSFAFFSAIPQVRLFFSSSVVIVLFHLLLNLPLLRFPCGVHLSAILWMFSVGILKTWPNHLILRRLISVTMSSYEQIASLLVLWLDANLHQNHNQYLFSRFKTEWCIYLYSFFLITVQYFDICAYLNDYADSNWMFVCMIFGRHSFISYFNIFTEEL